VQSLYLSSLSDFKITILHRHSAQVSTGGELAQAERFYLLERLVNIFDLLKIETGEVQLL